MAASPFALLRARRLGPLCAAQALATLNDNLLRNAVVVLALFRFGYAGAAFPAVTGAILVAPFVLLSASAGKLADRLDKARVMQAAMVLDVLLMACAGVGFLTPSIPALLVVLFLLGARGAVCTTVKYSILPQHLPEPELLAANGAIGATTFLAILLGTAGGGALVLLRHGTALVAAAGVAIALLGFAASRAIPPAPPAAAGTRPRWNVLGDTLIVVRDAWRIPAIRLSILGLGWFWTLGAGLIAEFPPLVRQTLQGDGQVATLLLSVFAIGIGLGAMSCARLLRGEVSPRHLPFIALAAAGFCWDFAHAAARAPLATPAIVLTDPAGWRLLADLLLLAGCGGAFSVPLYAIIQAAAPVGHEGRMIAATSVVTSLCMVAGAVVLVALDRAGVTPPHMLTGVAGLNLLAALVIIRIIPRQVMHLLARWYFHTVHGVRVTGLEHYRDAGERVVIVANHLSHFDAWLIISCLPDFPVVVAWYGLPGWGWKARLLLASLDVLTVGVDRPHSVKRMIETVRDHGRKLLIFPEGRTTQTGTLQRIYEGAGVVADKAGARVLAIGLDGPQYTGIGNLAPHLRRRSFVRCTVHIRPAADIPPAPSLTPRQRRQQLGQMLHQLLSEATFAARPTDRTLFAALLDARARFGGGTAVCEDIARTPLGYDRIVLGAAALGRPLRALTTPGERVGVLLPTASGTLVAFMALQAFGLVPAMLNLTVGAGGLLAACRAAEVRLVVSSRRFIARVPRLAATVARMEEAVRFLWLEDVRAAIGPAARLRAWVDARRAYRLPGARLSPDAPAVVLFTSGSEGTPKGVVLSHANIVANCAQLTTAIGVRPTDRVFNAMPMFHSFGLSGALLPLFHGLSVFQYPSPLHYRTVPAMVYDSMATICMGSDTFLKNWGKFANAYDFSAVRLLVSGGERLSEETRRLFADRFGVRVLEGYGITETGPVLCVNTLSHHRSGTTGRFLPGIAWRLDPVPGIARGGRLLVRGPNVMLGYLSESAPGVLEPPPGGWFDTGDIVDVDAEGFVTIIGRARRFAKIGGEMVSMAAAEALVMSLWPEDQHAVISLPDARKGERLVLVTTRHDADAGALLRHARAGDVAELFVPRSIITCDALPMLAHGKTDYPALAVLASGVCS